MEILKQNSIHVPPIFRTYYPQFDEESTVNMNEVRSKFPGRYATNNSTICFVTTDGEIFVTPYTREAFATLRQANFAERYFYVPMSNGDLPKDLELRAKWKTLREQARKAYDRYYEEDCAKWCNDHGIGHLSEETMRRCLRIPTKGIPVKHHHFQAVHRPLCSETMLDCTAVDMLGHFDTNNGTVVFVYRDGHTYITKGYGIIDELKQAGYQESDLFVPMSNGETIVDRTLAAKWANLPKK